MLYNPQKEKDEHYVHLFSKLTFFPCVPFLFSLSVTFQALLTKYMRTIDITESIIGIISHNIIALPEITAKIIFPILEAKINKIHIVQDLKTCISLHFFSLFAIAINITYIKVNTEKTNGKLKKCYKKILLYHILLDEK